MTNPVPLPIESERLIQLLSGFVREEIAKSGFSRGVVGVSGGLDSAAVLLVASRALGPENVLGILMPYRSSSPSSLSDARAVAEVAGCQTEEVFAFTASPVVPVCVVLSHNP